MHGGDGSTPAGCLDIFVKHLESESGIPSRRTCPVQFSGGTNEDTFIARRDPFFGPGCKPLTDGLDFALRAIENQNVRLRSVEQGNRSEEHTSELQSRQYLVCRLLLEQ